MHQVTEKEYNKAKKLLETESITKTAEKIKRSRSTVSRIKDSDSYSIYTGEEVPFRSGWKAKRFGIFRK